jgi:catalase
MYAQIMPFDDAPGYRFNPFDLTKVWPHADYPLTEVGRFSLDRNPVDNHTEMEQFAPAPSNMVPGIGPSPDRMLMARMFSYADSHRYRLGVNYQQIPVNAPVAPVHTYSKDGLMRVVPRTDPVYFPNSKGGPVAVPGQYTPPSWYTAGEIVRTAFEEHAEDDDFVQVTALVRNVLDDAARDRLVGNIVGQLLNGVTEPVLQRTFGYLRNVDQSLGDRVEKGVRDGHT